MAEKGEAGAAVIESATPRWRFAHVEFDTRSGEIKVDGRVISLERKPREMLGFFLKHPGELLTKSDLLDAVWPGRIVTEGSVTNCIGKLRGAINDPEGHILRTVHGYGYRLACAVQIAPHQAEPASPELESGSGLPGLEGWQLQQQLAQGPHVEVWRVQAVDGGATRIVKLARSGSGIDLLRREAAIIRYFKERLGTAVPAATVLGARLDEAPIYLELEDRGGIGLPACLARDPQAMDLAARIGLMAQAADVVATLHAYGVQHGELKPDSFSVEMRQGAPPRVILAQLGRGLVRNLAIADGPRSAGAEGFSPEGNLYAAPELLSGAAHSVQSDLYALGVILYQTLAGDFTRPLAPGWEQQVGDPLLCQDIAAASHIDPAQRLGDAAELARRLRDLPARRAALADLEQRRVRLENAERALQRARARRGPLLGLAAVLVLGLGISSWLAIHLRQAVVEEKRSATVAGAVTEFLARDLLAPANGEAGHAADTTIDTLLDRASGSLDTRFADQPLMHASLQRVLGTAYAALSEPKKAVPLLLSAETSLARLEGPAATDTEAARTVLQELYNNTPLTSTNLEDVESVAQRQLDAEIAAGHPHPAAEYIARVGLDCAHCWSKAGTLRGANCANAIDEVYAESTRKLGPDDPVTLRLMHIRASLMGVAGRPDAAIPEFRKALAGLQKIYGPDSPRLTLLMQQMSKALEYGGDPAQAIPLLQEAIRVFSTSLGPHHPYLWNARRALGTAYVRSGRYREAVDLQASQLDYVVGRFGPESREYLTALRFLAAAEVAAGDTPQAIAHIDAGLALNAHVKTDPYDGLELRDLRVSTEEAKGEFAEAMQLAQQNVDAARSLAPGADVPIGRYELHLARLLLQQDRRAEAYAAAGRALDRLGRLLDADAPLMQAAREVQQKSRDAATARS